MTPQSLVMRVERATTPVLAGHASMQAVFGEAVTESDTLGD
jgi:hypothetical protein